jgi:hypothetical protein
MNIGPRIVGRGFSRDKTKRREALTFAQVHPQQVFFVPYRLLSTNATVT